MKKLRDIFYNKNDILVALLIVAVAAFVISNRIDSILAYPSSLEAQAAIAASNKPDSTPVQYTGREETKGDEEEGTLEEGLEGEGAATSEGAIDTDVPPQNSDGTNPPDNTNTPDSTEPVNHSVYIAPGSTATEIADILIGIKLFETRQAFFDAVSAASADTKLRAGTFIIPSTATPEQVVSILTR